MCIFSTFITAYSKGYTEISLPCNPAIGIILASDRFNVIYVEDISATTSPEFATHDLFLGTILAFPGTLGPFPGAKMFPGTRPVFLGTSRPIRGNTKTMCSEPNMRFEYASLLHSL